MKHPRILAALFLALSLPAVTFAAAGEGKVSSVTGTASGSNGDTSTELKADSVITQGEAIETGPGSALELQLSGGATLVLGPSTRIRVKTLQDSGAPGSYSYEVILLRGTLSGNATGSLPGSNLSVRTTAGVANVAGSRFFLDYTPISLTTGNFTVVSGAGSISLLPTNGIDPVIIPGGAQTITGPNIPNRQPAPAAPSALARANGTNPTPFVPKSTVVVTTTPPSPLVPSNYKELQPDPSPLPPPNFGQINIYKPTIPNSSVPISADGAGAVN